MEAVNVTWRQTAATGSCPTGSGNVARARASHYIRLWSGGIGMVAWLIFYYQPIQSRQPVCGMEEVGGVGEAIGFRAAATTGSNKATLRTEWELLGVFSLASVGYWPLEGLG